MTALEAAAARLRVLVETTPLPADVADAIRDAYAALGDDVPVAVRSSATAEDGAEASFAGQQDTYLWVVGADAVVEHVRRCWGEPVLGALDRLPRGPRASRTTTSRWPSSSSGWSRRAPPAWR